MKNLFCQLAIQLLIFPKHIIYRRNLLTRQAISLPMYNDNLIWRYCIINKDKIVFNTQIHFTYSHSGATVVKILKLFDDGCALVQAGKKPFIRPI